MQSGDGAAAPQAIGTRCLCKNNDNRNNDLISKIFGSVAKRL